MTKKQIILSIIIIILYLLSNFYFDTNLSKEFTEYINPIFFLGLGIFLIKDINDYKRTTRNRKQIIENLIITVALYLIIYMGSGLIFGFLTLPYQYDIVSVLKNIWMFIIPITSRELLRTHFVLTSRKNKLPKILITVLLIIYSINLNSLPNLNDMQGIVKFLLGTLVPVISMNVVLTYLSTKGSYIFGLIYVLPVNILPYCIHLTPNIDWFIEGIAKLVLAFILFFFTYYESMKNNLDFSKRDQKKNNPIKLIPLVSILVITVLFVSGVFKYQAVAVASNSMYPEFSRGDSVIVRKLDQNELRNLEKYNIIMYKVETHYVMHRITNIEHDEGGKLIFTTKGDNNAIEDHDKVTEDQIIGKIEFSIPLIGYPSLLLSESLK